LFKRWLVLQKRSSEEALDRIKVALFLKKKGKESDLKYIYPLLEDKDWNVRNAAASTLIRLVSLYPHVKASVLDHMHKLIGSASLAIKLTILEVLGKLKDYSSKEIIVKILDESDFDLQYAAIRAIGFLDDVDVLYSLKNVVYVKDYITRRAAILSIIRIANSVEESKQIEELTPHIHLLIEAYIELNELSDIIYKILDYGDPDNFPEMRGYTEFEIVKLETLLEEHDYRVGVYQNFSRLVYPLYFPLPKE